MSRVLRSGLSHWRLMSDVREGNEPFLIATWWNLAKGCAESKLVVDQDSLNHLTDMTTKGQISSLRYFASLTGKAEPGDYPEAM